MSKLQTLSLLTSFLALAACDPKTSELSMSPGTYEGSLITQANGKYQQTSVKIDVTGDELPSTISVNDMRGEPALTVRILNTADSSIELQSSLGMSTPLTLKSDDKATECYTAKADVAVTLCPSKTGLTFDIRDSSKNIDIVSLSLHLLDTKNTSEPDEKPQAFTLSQAIERARTMSFQSRIEYEHVIQAKNQAKAAYLHLLPQLTLSTVANNITVAPLAFAATFTTALQDIGDLAPFLLPSRWFQAAAAKDQSKAEQDTYKLMRLDMGVQVEGLFYTYERDKASAAFTTDTLSKAVAIQKKVRILQNLGALPPPSAENMDAIVNQIEANQISFKSVLAEDLSAVSASLGFFSPIAVTDATVDNEQVPIDAAVSYEYPAVNSLALQQAIELNQMDDLIAAAKQQKHASYFSFLDPYGDPNLGLGAALPAQIAVQSSQIRELGIDRDQLKEVISQRSFNGVTDYGTALLLYQKSKEAMSIQQTRLNTETNYLNNGTNVDFFGLVQIFQDYLNAEINLESARANYRVARSEIDRLLLQGYYARF
jgi:hypothetical protein